MIPKIIHYCWFGGKEMPPLAKKCIKSWNKYCPDYKLMLWNESNFNIESNQYVKEAYSNKKYAFVTDYVRLWALYNYGGVYMDTDVEVKKPIDIFLIHSAFSGFESDKFVPTGIMASEKGHHLIKDLLNDYNDRRFIRVDGTLDLTTNTQSITKELLQRGLILNNECQEVDGFMLYPSDYFCPIDWETKEKKETVNTYTIHWFSGSWHSKKEKIRNKKIMIKKNIVKIMKYILGESIYKKVIKFIKGEI